METVVRRHKTLGTWVPLWVPGPCRNPECAAYDATGAGNEETGPLEHTRPPEDTAPPATGRPGTAPGESVAKNP
ncbi:hypothetical protein GCM10010384_61490 [Streptomyces djakartensis]|uniref:Uncharacterized protein n=1 Tax=Streptomyces djakartensis TaxID=68193 RepID=A0ABQ3AF64_9ACTN|nr:hypothetical protein GCM10010384_61490 [Streptomyces djakartensis]